MRYQEFCLIFFIYSFLGWLWETFPCSAIELDKIHNRGFLLGPICPIYGLGASLSFGVLKNFESSLEIFIYSAFLSCLIEYIIGYLLEKFFHKRWWDYSNYPFQIKRRVCLYGLLIFGLANILIVKKLTPILLFSLSLSSDRILDLLVISFGILFAIDLILTLNHLTHGFKTLNKVYEVIDDNLSDYFNGLNESERLANLKVLEESKKFKSKLLNINSNLKEREENIKKLIRQK
ncbi:MAG: putative ABC transporter permease [Peptoniphilus harei]|uniref:putative ABC transporter permease n=1 Tax=Peptoniphilus harei TaxID=54005 RepID=UPI00255086D3|nr:putative ABC transporter permease [Peptoniphilus harei]MDK7754247.1 putative ABC transporter permease [Peptoniphilus harei]MDK7760052.1 putative ABC transporter permease [Peptoniphilus harei]MDK8271609.1 putative ABC transporter permease [Peptoniphilus harei]MDK8340093.1 putative ABC transporter permease [Peptoniphilus harei]MDU7532867.1 putative ABC transporter permease [Peptoniphilus harei]